MERRRHEGIIVYDSGSGKTASQKERIKIKGLKVCILSGVNLIENYIQEMERCRNNSARFWKRKDSKQEREKNKNKGSESACSFESKSYENLRIRDVDDNVRF